MKPRLLRAVKHRTLADRSRRPSPAEKSLIIGNWKMSMIVPQARRLAEQLRKLRYPRSSEIVVCPSFTALAEVRTLLAGSPVLLGAQDVFWGIGGEHTGSISIEDLRALGCHYVIIGHSERRRDQSETDAMVNKKALTVLGHGLSPVICVGESQAERQRHLHYGAVGRQVHQALHNLPPPRHGQRLVIAYEPIWAVGVDQPEESSQAFAMADVIHQALVDAYGERLTDRQTRLIYGGSVFPDNVRSFIDFDHFQGVLLGRAGQNALTFSNILKALD